MKPHIRKKLRENPNKIKVLHLADGRISNFPREIFNFHKLKSLDLFANSINSLPEEMYKLDKLEHFSLSNNRFTEFPKLVFIIPNLVSFSIKDNRLDSIDSSCFSNILKIKKVDLSNNRIKYLPSNSIASSGIEELNLSGNQFKKFPEGLSNVNSLRKLNLSRNNIKAFDEDDFSSLVNLEELDLSYNDITYLPTSISTLSKLKKLNLSGNQIVGLPKEFESLTKLESLELSGNPMESTPIEIQAQGPQGIINYYLSLGENVKLYEAKLLIVGQGSVGKTFIMNRIVYNISPETNTTEGIDITNWTIETESSDNFRVNVWDFGGQEIYHSTHQFFLTKRSLYLLVWEARSDQHLISFDYWLNVIKLLSAESPTLIVLNKIDERILSIDEKSLKEKFKNIKAFHQVSAKTGKNIEDLTSSIKGIIDKLPLIGDKLPKVWVDIRSELEGLDSNSIDYSQYLEICNKYGLSNKKALFLSQYFHDLGVFLHFQENFLLKNIIFLKPEWATNAVYKILDSKEIIQNYGEFEHKQLENVLSDYARDKHPYIIELMKKFELCYGLSKNRYLIPELLKPEKVEFDWNDKGNLVFEYHYEFMPAGILARFIVRIKDLILNNTQWKNGVVLEREKAFALVVSDQFSRRIKIRIKGANRAYLLDIIRREFDHINHTLNYFDVAERVPCICTRCENDDNPFMFNYKFVKGASHLNRLKTVNCENSYQGVNVERLIGLYAIDRKEELEYTPYNTEKLFQDLLEACSRILERKSVKKIENLLNDDLSDLLRMKGHQVSDQTRSGSSGLAGADSGELDLMIRNRSSIPVAIIECFRLASCGPENKIIAQHITKLLENYDTHGLKRNFIVVFSESKKFGRTWDNYVKYINDLNNHNEFGGLFPLSGFSRQPDFSSNVNIKIGIGRHEREGVDVELFHIFVNMTSSYSKTK